MDSDSDILDDILDNDGIQLEDRNEPEPELTTQTVEGRLKSKKLDIEWANYDQADETNFCNSQLFTV